MSQKSNLSTHGQSQTIGPSTRNDIPAFQRRQHQTKQSQAPLQPNDGAQKMDSESEPEHEQEDAAEKPISFVGSLWNLAKDAKDLAAKQLDILLDQFPFKQQQQLQQQQYHSTINHELRVDTEANRRYSQTTHRIPVQTRATSLSSRRSRSSSEAPSFVPRIIRTQDMVEQVFVDSLDTDSTHSQDSTRVSSTPSAFANTLEVSTSSTRAVTDAAPYVPNKGQHQKKDEHTSARRTSDKYSPAISRRNSVKVASGFGTSGSIVKEATTTDPLSRTASTSTPSSLASYPKYPTTARSSMPKEVTRADVHDSHDFKETFRQQNTTAVVAVEETLSAVSTEIPSTASRSAKPQPAIPTSPLSNERLEEALQEIATLKQQMGGQIEDIKRQVEILSSRGSAVHIERTQSALAPREGPPTPPPPPPMTPISSKRWFVPQSTAANSMQRVLDQLKTTPIQLKKTNSPFIKRRSAAVTSVSDAMYTKVVFTSSRQDLDDASTLLNSPSARRSQKSSTTGLLANSDASPLPLPRTPVKNQSRSMEVGKSPCLQWPSTEALKEADEFLDAHTQELSQRHRSETTASESLITLDSRIRTSSMPSPVPNPFASVSKSTTRAVKRTFSDISIGYPEEERRSDSVRAPLPEEPNSIFSSLSVIDRERSGPPLDYKIRKPMPSTLHDRDRDRNKVRRATTESKKRMPLKALPVSTATAAAAPSTTPPFPAKTRHVSFQEDTSVLIEGRWDRDYDMDSWHVSGR